MHLKDDVYCLSPPFGPNFFSPPQISFYYPSICTKNLRGKDVYIDAEEGTPRLRSMESLPDPNELMMKIKIEIAITLAGIIIPDEGLKQNLACFHPSAPISLFLPVEFAFLFFYFSLSIFDFFSLSIEIGKRNKPAFTKNRKALKNCIMVPLSMQIWTGLWTFTNYRLTFEFSKLQNSPQNFKKKHKLARHFQFMHKYIIHQTLFRDTFDLFLDFLFLLKFLFFFLLFNFIQKCICKLRVQNEVPNICIVIVKQVSDCFS